MPLHRLARTRAAYVDDERSTPERRCICGSAMNEPHAPECYVLRVEREHEPDLDVLSDEPGYGMGI